MKEKNAKNQTWNNWVWKVKRFADFSADFYQSQIFVTDFFVTL